MIKNAARRRALAVATFAALGAGASAACSHREQEVDAFQGIVEFEESVLAFEVPGRIDEVAVRRGDVVKAGTVVAKLDATLARLTRQARADEANASRAELALLQAGARREDVAALAAEVSVAQASTELAKKTAERARALRASGAVAAAELDRAESDLERVTAQRKSAEQRLWSLSRGARKEEVARAEARLEAARSAMELEDARLERYELKAETDGFVLDVHVRPTELANVGSPAATVADVAHPYVDVFVPQGELGGIRVGTKATVRVDSVDPSKGAVASIAANGAVEYLSPTTEFTPRFIFSERERPHLVLRVRVRVDDAARVLHAGVPAFVRFAR